MEKTIKYRYACNDNNDVVDISNVDDEYRKHHQFHCLECGQAMIARIGDINDHHFAHKASEKCDPDRYLHTLAERLIKQKFDTQGLSIKLGQTFICSRFIDCPFYQKDYSTCVEFQEESYDLKKFYDTCAMEKQIGPYIADLLLSNSKKPQIEPLLIEIKVTHSCTDKKINSEFRIIELSINSEQQLLSLLESSCLEEQKYYDNHMRDLVYFNKSFNREVVEKRDLSGCTLISRFILYQSKACILIDVSCADRKSRKQINSLLEMNVIRIKYSNDFWFAYGGKINGVEDICLFKVSQLGFPIRNCKLCKYHKYRTDLYSSSGKLFCCLYKKYGLDEFPKQTNALHCNYYRYHKELVESVLKDLSEFHFEIIS